MAKEAAKMEVVSVSLKVQKSGYEFTVDREVQMDFKSVPPPIMLDLVAHITEFLADLTTALVEKSNEIHEKAGKVL